MQYLDSDSTLFRTNRALEFRVAEDLRPNLDYSRFRRFSSKVGASAEEYSKVVYQIATLVLGVQGCIGGVTMDPRMNQPHSILGTNSTNNQL